MDVDGSDHVDHGNVQPQKQQQPLQATTDHGTTKSSSNSSGSNGSTAPGTSDLMGLFAPPPASLPPAAPPPPTSSASTPPQQQQLQKLNDEEDHSNILGSSTHSSSIPMIDDVSETPRSGSKHVFGVKDYLLAAGGGAGGGAGGHGNDGEDKNAAADTSSLLSLFSEPTSSQQADLGRPPLPPPAPFPPPRNDVEGGLQQQQNQLLAHQDHHQQQGITPSETTSLLQLFPSQTDDSFSAGLDSKLRSFKYDGRSPSLSPVPTSSLRKQKQQWMTYDSESGDASEAIEGKTVLSDETKAFLLAKELRKKTTTIVPPESNRSSRFRIWWNTFKEHHLLQSTTYAGSFMFLLYHVVFCLANGSAIIRPHSMDRPILGIMAKTTTVGIVFSAPLFISRLGQDVPALYPSCDLFLAPFLANAAKNIDTMLYEEHISSSGGGVGGGGGSTSSSLPYSDEEFFATFTVLSAIGMFLAGAALRLAASFKLANLGTYLPYSVLCGFFSAVGVLLWSLGFSVDSNGKTWKDVFLYSNGDIDLMYKSIIHHLPSLIVGILMNRLGPKNPFYVLLLIAVTVLMFYIIMFVTETSLQQAQKEKWFWSYDELVYHDDFREENPSKTAWMLPPTPFTNIFCIFNPYTNWNAVYQGIGDMFALSFLYLLRSSIHASALKKNINNLVRRIPTEMTPPTQHDYEVNENIGPNTTPLPPETVDETPVTTSQAYTMASNVYDSVRQGVQQVNMSLAEQDDLPSGPVATATAATPGATISATLTTPSLHEGSNLIDHGTSTNGGANNEAFTPIKKRFSDYGGTTPANDADGPDATNQEGYIEIRPKPTRRSLEGVFEEYAYALFVVAGCGGFGNCPTVATSNTMYAIGADGPAPQYGSVILLLIFYFTDFQLVQYIPKTVFSSLLVLGAVDTLVVWFIGAYHKTQDFVEWLIVPTIVAFSLFVGFLNAVFLGIGISLFVFVANFFRVGVVKFNASGLEIRSRIERSMAQSIWLDSHGDYIQVLVLQNYLFFGNASSILHYISTMFEDVDEAESMRLDFSIPPMPKVLVMDLSLVTGMDTSTIDIFAEIKQLCKTHDCKLYLCGLSPRMRKGLALGGVKPEGGIRQQRLVRLFPDLDIGLGFAEDYLIHTEMGQNSLNRITFGDCSTSAPMSHTRGFLYSLEQIDELHDQEFASSLRGLEQHVSPIRLQPGDCLFQCDGGIVNESERGLFFIESG